MVPSHCGRKDSGTRPDEVFLFLNEDCVVWFVENGAEFGPRGALVGVLRALRRTKRRKGQVNGGSFVLAGDSTRFEIRDWRFAAGCHRSDGKGKKRACARIARDVL